MKTGETVINPEKREKILESMDILEGYLDGQDWFSESENASLADLSILAAYSTLYHVGLDVSSYSNVTSWYERCSSLPGFSENEKGAKMFGSFLKSKLTEPF